MFNRSRRNLARWFTLSMGSILVVFTGVLYNQEVNERLEDIDRLLYKKASVMAANVQFRRYSNQWQVKLDRVPFLGSNPLPPDSEIVYARWYNAQGNLVQYFGTPPPEQLRTQMTTISAFQTIKTTDNLSGPKPLWLRQVTLAVQESGIDIGYLQVGIPLTPTQEALRGFLLLLTLAVPITLGLIAGAGWILGGLAMQPIHQAYEQLQRFTANASHELRTPLAVVLSNAQVALLTPTQDAAQQRLRLEKIVEVTKSMSHLIGNLLLLARHTTYLNTESLKTIDLTDLLRSLLNFYTPQTTEKALSLASYLPPYPIKLRAEPDLVRQAVSNLLSNALNYTPAGGTVQVRLFVQAHQVVIQVEDDGIGILEEDLSRIFERFYRVNQDRSKQSGGFGLGLAIAQQIIEAHQGHITVTSQFGQGTTFQIELPLR
ncbi:MAG: ATP-binding protein [Trichocoleus desertorum ATA4-8-CV12]|jgi:signal transduction histidine kinase|nr:ATP-binding protein [Trichocoleus desertorum ATA4-8-CV12]